MSSSKSSSMIDLPSSMIPAVLLGLQRHGAIISLNPCIPAVWPGYTLEWRIGRTHYRFTVVNPDHRSRGNASATLNGIAVDPLAIPLQDDDGEHEVSIVLGIAVGEVSWGSPSLGRGFRRPLPLKVQAVHEFPPTQSSRQLTPLVEDGERSLEPSPGSRPPRLPDFGRRADDGAPLGQSSAVPGKSHWFGHACLYRAHFVTMDSHVRF